jgi:mannosyltransferase
VTATPATSPGPWAYRVVLTAALLTGAWLRLFQLGTESVWLDEAYSIQTARGSLQYILGERLTDIHPPLYYFALHYWMQWAGDSEGGARLLSALFDFAAVLVAYPVAKRLLGPRVALVSTVLLAVSPFHVEFAQEARMYALLGLLSTLSMQAFLRFFDGARRVWLPIYIVSTALMLYTHVYSVFVPATQLAILALGWRGEPAFPRALRSWLVAQPIVLLLFAPWLFAFLEQLGRVQSAFWIPQPMVIQLLQPLWTYSGSVPLTFVVAPLALLGIRQIWADRAPGAAGPSTRVVLLAWFVTPVVLPFVISFISAPIFLPKYAIAASVPFAMLAARGATGLRTKRWRTWTVVAMAALSAWHFSRYYGTLQKDDWRNAVALLERTAEPNDTLVFYPWFNQIPFAFYQQRDDLIHRPFVAEPDDPAPPMEEIPALAERTADSGQRAWLVVLRGTPLKASIVGELGRVMTPVRQSMVQRVELYLFEKTR